MHHFWCLWLWVVYKLIESLSTSFCVQWKSFISIWCEKTKWLVIHKKKYVAKHTNCLEIHILMFVLTFYATEAPRTSPEQSWSSRLSWRHTNLHCQFWVRGWHLSFLMEKRSKGLFPFNFELSLLRIGHSYRTYLLGIFYKVHCKIVKLLSCQQIFLRYARF